MAGKVFLSLNALGLLADPVGSRRVDSVERPIAAATFIASPGRGHKRKAGSLRIHDCVPMDVDGVGRVACFCSRLD